MSNCCRNWMLSFSGEKDSSKSVDDVAPPHMRKEENHVDKPPPLLLTIHYDDEEQSFYNLVDNRCQTTRLPVLTNKTVLGSAYGWLVLLDNPKGDSRGSFCLWNPETTEIIQLPYLEDPSTSPYNRCILSSSPTNNHDPENCFVVFEQFDCSYQTVSRISDGSIIQVNYDELGYCILAMVSFQGSIYAVANPGFEYPYEFVTVDVVEDMIETRPLLIEGGKHHWALPDQLKRSWITCNMTYLIESPCGNELLLVIEMIFSDRQTSGVQFRVFRVDVSRKVCHELENLDGRTIFIGFYGNGFCCYSKSLIKPNSVYYTDNKGMAIHVYDLDDRSTTTLPPCSDFDFDTSWSTNYWVDLPHNILDYSGLAS